MRSSLDYDDYANRNRLDIRLNTKVTRIARSKNEWAIATADGQLSAGAVVVATGKYHTPVTPDWPGQDEFSGSVLHSSWYRNHLPFKGQRVLVVGPGASGFEIATQLAHGGAARVWLSIRTPPHIIHRNVGPFPSDFFAVLARRLPGAWVDRAGDLIRRATIGDLSAYGLRPPPDGIYTRVSTTGMIPTIDGPYIEAVKDGLVEVVPALERFGESAAVLEGGSRLPADVVISATGYKRNLEPLVGQLGVLTKDGHPAIHGADTHPSLPGLHFTGFTEPFSGNLRELRLDARRIARAIAKAAK